LFTWAQIFLSAFDYFSPKYLNQNYHNLLSPMLLVNFGDQIFQWTSFAFQQFHFYFQILTNLFVLIIHLMLNITATNQFLLLFSNCLHKFNSNNWIAKFHISPIVFKDPIIKFTTVFLNFILSIGTLFIFYLFRS